MLSSKDKAVSIIYIALIIFNIVACGVSYVYSPKIFEEFHWPKFNRQLYLFGSLINLSLYFLSFVFILDLLGKDNKSINKLSYLFISIFIKGFVTSFFLVGAVVGGRMTIPWIIVFYIVICLFQVSQYYTIYHIKKNRDLFSLVIIIFLLYLSYTLFLYLKTFDWNFVEEYFALNLFLLLNISLLINSIGSFINYKSIIRNAT